MPLPVPYVKDPENQRNFDDLSAKADKKVEWGLGTVASATTIAIPDNVTLIAVTGTTNIETITATAPGRAVILNFSDALTVVDGSNLVIAGDFTTSANDTLTLVCNGTNFYEISRSEN